MNAEKMLERFRKWSLSKCIETTAKDLQLYVRLRDADKSGYASCCSCGVRQHYKKMNGGHYVSRAFKATILNDKNVHAQCVRCNVIDNLPGYTLFMESTYGEGFHTEMMAAAREHKTWTREELVELRVELRKKIKQLESDLK